MNKSEKLQVSLRALQNQVLAFRPSNREIKYQFEYVKQLAETRTALAVIENLENLILENKVSTNEMRYQFESARERVL